jgi:FtsP/CotA-like multicopper oxidase with cupredoxin domain
MSNQKPSRSITRRGLLKLGGGILATAAGTYLLPKAVAAWGPRADVSRIGLNAPVVNGSDYTYRLAATDGWIYLPPRPSPTTYHPDPWATEPFNTYTFGFRELTSLTNEADVRAQKGLVQASAPLLYAQQGGDLRIILTNLGFATRPDLTDGHTVHFHGFPNAIPAFDGVPELSIGVPYGRSYTYFYRPRDPGTYMYHCHFEDVEHVSMGMTGVVFVRPTLGANYVYNDASTVFNREFAMFLSEIWTQERWEAAHIQEHDWSDYEPDYWLINGRVFPDTLEPNGDPMVTPARPELQYQPISSLVQCNSDDRVLLRFVNLGFQQHAMRADGLTFDVVGKDAKFLGPTPAQTTPPAPAYPDRRYQTDTILIAPGESYDVIFTAPRVDTPTTYLLYNRKLAYLNNGGEPYGGQMTEVRVFPAGTLQPQTAPNA